MGLFKSTRTAAILGCGPAGLFAAHGLIQNGWDVTIYSRKRRSEMFGAQYLHRSIPGLSDPNRAPHEIHYNLVGSADDYRSKVYGRRSGVTVSPEVLGERHPAWDIREAYYKAWGLYADLIQPVDEITPSWFGERQKDGFWGAYKVVISSIPRTALCYRFGEHMFDSQTVWAIGDAPERGIFCPVTEAAPDQVILNGSRDFGWYRNSNIYGYRTAEWAGEKKPPIENLARVVKPLSTDCNCWDHALTRVGRYGTWTKGVLSHEAYQMAVKIK